MFRLQRVAKQKKALSKEQIEGAARARRRDMSPITRDLAMPVCVCVCMYVCLCVHVDVDVCVCVCVSRAPSRQKCYHHTSESSSESSLE